MVHVDDFGREYETEADWERYLVNRRLRDEYWGLTNVGCLGVDQAGKVDIYFESVATRTRWKTDAYTDREDTEIQQLWRSLNP